MWGCGGGDGRRGKGVVLCFRSPFLYLYKDLLTLDYLSLTTPSEFIDMEMQKSEVMEKDGLVVYSKKESFALDSLIYSAFSFLVLMINFTTLRNISSNWDKLMG
jgi:hypothetical protein